MKVLLATPDVIDKVGNRYFSNAVSIFLSRYKSVGEDFVITNPINVVSLSKSDEISEKNVNYIAIRKINTLKDLLCSNRKNRDIVTEAIKGCDLIIAHVPSFNGELVANIGHKLGKKVVCVVMACPWDAYWNYNFKGKLIAPLRYFSLRNLAKNTKFLIYVTKTFLQRRYPSKGVSIACSNVQIKTGDDIVLKRRIYRIEEIEKIKNPVLKIATIAAIDVPFKGQKYVIDALSKLKKLGRKYNYYLIGGGDDTFLKKYATEKGISDQIFFEGVIPHSSIPLYLDSVDIYIQPSKQEGLPRSVIEAMSRGCLCLGSNIAGIPELLHKDYLFKKGRSNEITKLLLNVTAEKLRQCAMDNFNKAKEYDQSILDKNRVDFFKNIL